MINTLNYLSYTELTTGMVYKSQSIRLYYLKILITYIIILSLTAGNNLIWFDKKDGDTVKNINAIGGETLTIPIKIVSNPENTKKLDIIFLLDMHTIGNEDIDEFKVQWLSLDNKFKESVGSHGSLRYAFIPYVGDSDTEYVDNYITTFFSANNTEIRTSAMSYSTVSQYLNDLTENYRSGGLCKEDHYVPLSIALQKSKWSLVAPCEGEYDCEFRPDALKFIFYITGSGTLARRYSSLKRASVALKQNKIYVNLLTPKTQAKIPCPPICSEYITGGKTCRIDCTELTCAGMCISGKVCRDTSCSTYTDTITGCCSTTGGSCSGTRLCKPLDSNTICYDLKELVQDTGGLYLTSLNTIALSSIKSKILSAFEEIDQTKFTISITSPKDIEPTLSGEQLQCSPDQKSCEFILESGQSSADGCNNPYPCEITVSLTFYVPPEIPQSVYPFTVSLISQDTSIKEYLDLQLNVMVPAKTSVSFQGYNLLTTSIIYFEIENIDNVRVLYPEYDRFVFHCNNEVAQLLINQHNEIKPKDKIWGFADCLRPAAGTSIDVSLFQVYGTSAYDSKEDSATVELIDSDLNIQLMAVYILETGELKISLPSVKPEIFLVKLVERTNQSNILRSKFMEGGFNTLSLDNIPLSLLEDSEIVVIVKLNNRLTQVATLPAYNYYKVSGLHSPEINEEWDENGNYILKYTQNSVSYGNFTASGQFDLLIDDDIIIEINSEEESYKYTKRLYSTDTGHGILINDGSVFLSYEKPLGTAKTIIKFNATTISTEGRLIFTIKGTRRSILKTIYNYRVKKPMEINTPTSIFIIPRKSKTFDIRIRNTQDIMDSFRICGSGNGIDIKIEDTLLLQTICFTTEDIKAGEEITIPITLTMNTESETKLSLDVYTTNKKLKETKTIAVIPATFTDSNIDGQCSLSSMRLKCDFAFNNAGNTDNTYYFGVAANILLSDMGFSTEAVTLKPKESDDREISLEILPYELDEDKKNLLKYLGQVYIIAQLYKNEPLYSKTDTLSKYYNILVETEKYLGIIGGNNVISSLNRFKATPDETTSVELINAITGFYNDLINIVKQDPRPTTQKQVELYLFAGDTPIKIDDNYNVTTFVKKQLKTLNFRINIKMIAPESIDLLEDKEREYRAQIINNMDFPVFVDYKLNLEVGDSIKTVIEKNNQEIKAQESTDIIYTINPAEIGKDISQGQIILMVSPTDTDTTFTKTSYIFIKKKTIIDFEVTSEQEDLTAKPGETIEFNIKIKNTGNKVCIFQIIPESDELDDISIIQLSEGTVSINPNESQDIVVTLQTPEHPTFSSATFQLKIKPRANPQITKKLQFRINIMGPDTSMTSPESISSDSINITFTNQGETQDIINLRLEGELEDCLNLETEHFILNAGETRSIKIDNKCEKDGKITLIANSETGTFYDTVELMVSKIATPTPELSIPTEEAIPTPEPENKSSSIIYPIIAIIVIASAFVFINAQKKKAVKQTFRARINPQRQHLRYNSRTSSLQQRQGKYTGYTRYYRRR